MNNTKNNIYGPKTKEEALFQNTYLLLKNYRNMKWSVELSTKELSQNIDSEFFMSLDEYLDTLYGAGVSRYDGKIESHAKNTEMTVQMLSLLMSAVDFIKEKHEKGDEYYQVLYYTFFTHTKLSIDQILSSLAGKGYYYGYRTYYRKRKEAIDTLSVVLWGYSACPRLTPVA